jgi:hypothetical protein
MNNQNKKDLPDMPLAFYRSDNGTRDSEFSDKNDESPDNPYFQMISTLAPGEMVGQFMKTASPRVQVAAFNQHAFPFKFNCFSPLEHKPSVRKFRPKKLSERCVCGRVR